MIFCPLLPAFFSKFPIILWNMVLALSFCHLSFLFPCPFFLFLLFYRRSAHSLFLWYFFPLRPYLFPPPRGGGGYFPIYRPLRFRWSGSVPKCHGSGKRDKKNTGMWYLSNQPCRLPNPCWYCGHARMHTGIVMHAGLLALADGCEAGVERRRMPRQPGRSEGGQQLLDEKVITCLKVDGNVKWDRSGRGLSLSFSLGLWRSRVICNLNVSFDENVILTFRNFLKWSWGAKYVNLAVGFYRNNFLSHEASIVFSCFYSRSDGQGFPLKVHKNQCCGSGMNFFGSVSGSGTFFAIGFGSYMNFITFYLCIPVL
jgi:hypothetical protein